MLDQVGVAVGHPASCMYKVDQSAILLHFVAVSLNTKGRSKKVLSGKKLLYSRSYPWHPKWHPLGLGAQQAIAALLHLHICGNAAQIFAGDLPNCHERSRTKIL